MAKATGRDIRLHSTEAHGDRESKRLPFPIRKSIDFGAAAITLERRQPQPALATSNERRRPVRIGGVRVSGERRCVCGRPAFADPCTSLLPQRLNYRPDGRNVTEQQLSFQACQAVRPQEPALRKLSALGETGQLGGYLAVAEVPDLSVICRH